MVTFAANLAQYCPRSHPTPVLLTVGHFCLCFSQVPKEAPGHYFTEVDVVCLMMEYARVVTGSDYRTLINSSVQCPNDVDSESFEAMVRRCALMVQSVDLA